MIYISYTGLQTKRISVESHYDYCLYIDNCTMFLMICNKIKRFFKEL